MINHSICQDCLRLNPIHPTNDGECVCGGETCSCQSCTWLLEQLQKGRWNKKFLELQLKNPIVSWSVENGGIHMEELTKEQLLTYFDHFLGFIYATNNWDALLSHLVKENTESTNELRDILLSRYEEDFEEDQEEIDVEELYERYRNG